MEGGGQAEISESFMLEKTLKIIKSNCKPHTANEQKLGTGTLFRTNMYQ